MENCFSLASLNNKQSTWADDRAFKCLLFRALSAKFVFSSLMKSPCRVKAHKGLSHPSQLSSKPAVSSGEPGCAAAPGGQPEPPTIRITRKPLRFNLLARGGR